MQGESKGGLIGGVLVRRLARRGGIAGNSWVDSRFRTAELSGCEHSDIPFRKADVPQHAVVHSAKFGYVARKSLTPFPGVPNSSGQNEYQILQR